MSRGDDIEPTELLSSVGGMARKRVDVAIIVPDASPLITLANIDRLDLLDTFAAPIKVPDQVAWEAQKLENDPQGRIGAWIARKGNEIEVVETMVGFGFLTKRATDPKFSSRGLGEIAVDEYATRIARSTGPGFIPLVLFEDPDVLELRIAKLKGVHLLNTAGWLVALDRAGIVEDAKDILRAINDGRKTPMKPFDKSARTKNVESTFIRKAAER
jgi:predicted nucleic acid-binding protein